MANRSRFLWPNCWFRCSGHCRQSNWIRDFLSSLLFEYQYHLVIQVNTITDSQFLYDSGAQQSLVPTSFTPTLNHKVRYCKDSPPDVHLYDAGNHPISVSLMKTPYKILTVSLSRIASLTQKTLMKKLVYCRDRAYARRGIL